MRKLLNFKSIRSKIIFGFSVALLFVVILAGYNYYAINQLNSGTENMIDEQLVLLIADEKIAFNTSQRLAAIRGYVLFDDEKYLDDFNKFTEESKEYQDLILAINSSEEVKQLIDRTVEWREIIINDVINEVKQGNRNQAMTSLEETVVPISEEILKGYNEMAIERETMMQQQGKENVSSGKAILYIGLGVSILVVIVGVISAIVTSGSISTPIRKVMERMKLIANGNLSLEPLQTKLRDETGQLVNATNEMNQQMKELLNQIHEVSETVSAQSEELTQSANEVKTGTEQVASTMQELAAGSETQANSASDLSSGMNTFAEKVQEANENGYRIEENSKVVLNMTNDGSDLMRKSIQQMEKIDSIVQDSVRKVEGLDKQSKEISNLVTVIKDVADQTNLLALNAAIEAARAGEHGKGFAVVADEVRKLAEQVSDSVLDITTIVDTIQKEASLVSNSLQGGYKEVEQGKAQIETTGETFEGITQAVTEMVSSIKTIAENLSEVAANAQEMNGSIEEIASVSEESAAGVEQTSASVQQTSSIMEEVAGSSEQLANLAEELNTLVRHFKL